MEGKERKEREGRFLLGRNCNLPFMRKRKASDQLRDAFQWARVVGEVYVLFIF